MERPPEPVFEPALHQARHDLGRHHTVNRVVGTVSALVAGGLGLVVLPGDDAIWWQRFLPGALAAGIGLLATWGLYYLIYTPFIAPYRQRNVARRYIEELEEALEPPPFDIRFQVIQPEHMTERHLNVVRLNVANHGPAGEFRAELIVDEARRTGSSRVPLEWTNHRGAKTHWLEGGETPAQLTLGEMELRTKLEDSEWGESWEPTNQLAYFVARTPDGPGTERMSPLEGHEQIRVTVRVLDIGNDNDDVSIRLAIGAAEDRGPFVDEQ